MTEGRLIQLPNKDLWRGFSYKEKSSEGNVDITPLPRPFEKLDKAMAAIQKAAPLGSSQLTCLWCGLQGDSKYMRDHLKTNHSTVVEPPSEAELALAAKKMEEISNKEE